MPQRRLDDFITGHLEYTENTESPRSYHLWASLSTIAAALQRRVWMKWGHTHIYPNQFIILIGPSGNRKGEPVTIARDLMKAVDIKMIAEAITREALAKFMTDSVTDFNYDKRRHVQCAITGVFEEVSVFLGEGDAVMLADLTNWYDSRDTWTRRTLSRGPEEILGVCMNILGSTAPDWIPLMIPYSAIGGGFTSRIIFVVEHKKGKIIEDPEAFTIDAKLRSDLIHDLERISLLIGEFKFDTPAREKYKRWYRAQKEAVMQGNPPIHDPRFSGYVSRRATHVKKIAMACSSSRDDSMVIQEKDFDRALLMMESVEQHMPSVFTSVGRSLYSEQTDTVLDFIKTRGPIKRSELMRILYYDIDVRTLSIIEENLLAMQVITRTPNFETHDVTYEWLG